MKEMNNEYAMGMPEMQNTVDIIGEPEMHNIY